MEHKDGSCALTRHATRGPLRGAPIACSRQSIAKTLLGHPKKERLQPPITSSTQSRRDYTAPKAGHAKKKTKVPNKELWHKAQRWGVILSPPLYLSSRYGCWPKTDIKTPKKLRDFETSIFESSRTATNGTKTNSSFQKKCQNRKNCTCTEVVGNTTYYANLCTA